MFRSFDNWFDRVSDGWNPVTVRDLRRLSRSWFFTIAMIAHLGLLAIVYFSLLMDPLLSDGEKNIFGIVPTGAALALVILLVISSDVRARLTDELFDVVPLTPKEKVHGILGTSCLLSAFFVVQALPFLVFPTAGPFSILTRLGFLLGGFVVTQILVLHFLSFSIRVRTTTEAVIAFVAVVYPLNLSLWVIYVPFLIMSLSWMVLPPPELTEYVTTSWLSIVVASIGGILALASFAYLNYRLALYHCGSRPGSYWRTIGFNLLCLFAWSFCWASLGFVVVCVLYSL